MSVFPGMGKTHFTYNKSIELGLSVLDIDSSRFIRGDWPQNYVDHIKNQIGNVDMILISTHSEVREALIENDIHFILVYPKRNSMSNYITRYEDRGNSDTFISFVEDMWEHWMDDLNSQQGCLKYVLDGDKYLSDIIHDGGRVSLHPERRQRRTKRRRRKESADTNVDRVNKRRTKLPRYSGIKLESTYTPYTLKWWLDLLGKASHEHRLAIMEHDMHNGMRFVLLWGWIQDRIIEKYGE